MRKVLTTLILVLASLIIVVIAKSLVLDRASYVSLQPSQIDIATSKSLMSSNYPNYLPIEGKDYTITSIKYFDNQDWAVVKIQPIGSWADPGTLLLEKGNGVYQKALGPDNSFNGVNLNGIPKSVVDYIKGGQ